MQTGALSLCILGDVSMLFCALSPQLITYSRVSGAPFLLTPTNVIVVSTLVGAFTCTVIAALHAIMYIRCFGAMSLNGQGTTFRKVWDSGLFKQFELMAFNQDVTAATPLSQPIKWNPWIILSLPWLYTFW
jgi:hypothetical protein